MAASRMVLAAVRIVASDCADPGFRAKQGAGSSSLLSIQTREDARPPFCRAKAGCARMPLKPPTVVDDESCECGEDEGSQADAAGSCFGGSAVLRLELRASAIRYPSEHQSHAVASSHSLS